jgi:hypothetical protein
LHRSGSSHDCVLVFILKRRSTCVCCFIIRNVRVHAHLPLIHFKICFIHHTVSVLTNLTTCSMFSFGRGNSFQTETHVVGSLPPSNRTSSVHLRGDVTKPHSNQYVLFGVSYPPSNRTCSVWAQLLRSNKTSCS